MRIEAILSREDLEKVLSDFAPLKIRLGDKGELLLFAPSEVSILEGQGLRFTCQGHLHWPVLGFRVPVTLKSLVVMIRPVVEKRPDGDALVFNLVLERADVAMVPWVIDEPITKLVNHELEARRVELSWNFAKTLSHIFPLPAVLETAASLGLRVDWGETRITSEAVVFGVSLEVNVERRVDNAAEGGGAAPSLAGEPIP